VPKVGAVLGYLDAAFLTPGVFDVLLTVHDAGAGTATSMTTFELQNNSVNLTGAGFALTNAEFSLIVGRKILKLAGDEVSVGGSISVRGSANVDGCQRIIKQYQLYRSTSSYPPTLPPLPPPPTPPDPAWTNILPAPVDYTPPGHPYQSFCFGFFSNIVQNGILTRVWSTLSAPCAGVPYLADTFWDTTSTTGIGGGGRHVVLLEVQDKPTFGVGPINTQYDTMVLWLDNKDIIVQISMIEGVAPCDDLHLKDFVTKKAKIRGIAWDPLIVDTAPVTPPNDNFGDYSMSFVKQADGGGSIPVLTPGIRVPNVLPGPPALPGGVLAEWDIIAAIDAGPKPSPYVPPPPGKLYRGESCTYDIYLSAYDKTLVGDGGSSHSDLSTFPVKIVNDL
jgi:hypothetical protein